MNDIADLGPSLVVATLPDIFKTQTIVNHGMKRQQAQLISF